MVGQLVDTDPSHFFYNEHLAANIMTYDEFIWTHGSTPGIIGVMDGSNMTFGHMGRINIATMKKMTCYVQDALPIRLKALHVINMSPIVQKCFDMIKPCIQEKMMNMVRLL